MAENTKGAVGNISSSRRGRGYSRYGSYEAMTVSDYEEQYKKQQLRDRIEIENAVNKYRFEQQKKYNKKLTEEEIKQYKEEVKKKQAIDKQIEESQQRKRDIDTKDRRNRAAISTSLESLLRGTGSIKNLSENIKTFFKEGTAFRDLSNSLKTLQSSFDKYIDTYSKYQSAINTRLQGSGKQFQGVGGIEDILSRAVGASPYISTKSLLDNVQKLAESGIAFNIEQRAFLETISDNIASTFSVFDSNLMRIIRLQQEDSTAARLGLEVTMTKYLNRMFQNTEYLNQTFDQVSSNLLEATSTLTTQGGVEFEGVVQKWLGSLVSLGLSSETATSIASAIGSLGSGNISSLGSSGIGQLLLLSAAQGGIDLGNIAQTGLSASTTNQLLASMVSYLSTLAGSGSNITRASYANVFGLNVSDLRAIGNVGNSLSDIMKEMNSYTDYLGNLSSSMSTIGERVNISEQLNNLFENAAFSMSANIATNPALLAMWKVTGLLNETVGGIPLPGSFAVDTHMSMSDVLRTVIMGASTLGVIGDLVTGLSGATDFSTTLSKLNILSPQVVARGTGFSGTDSLTENYRALIQVGDTSDMYQSAKQQSTETISTYESDTDAKISQDAILDIRDNVSSIATILNNLTDGTKSIAVKFDSSFVGL